MKEKKPIGVFDSGYGGLTILRSLQEKMPEYDFLYLGDNARSPYGTRSFDVVYEFTLEAVEYLFSRGCELVVLACNTASAKALRNIQQKVLAWKYPEKRVLGVIRPTTEVIGQFSQSGHIGIVATEGTVKSESYLIETAKFFPELIVRQQACPIWVPIIENDLHHTEGGKWFVQQDLQKLLATDPQIDTVLLACTHYPLLQDEISAMLPPNIKVIAQGDIVAESMLTYLQRHPEMDQKISRGGHTEYLTTENPEDFNERASRFSGQSIKASHIHL